MFFIYKYIYKKFLLKTFFGETVYLNEMKKAARARPIPEDATQKGGTIYADGVSGGKVSPLRFAGNMV